MLLEGYRTFSDKQEQKNINNKKATGFKVVGMCSLDLNDHKKNERLYYEISSSE